MTYAEVRETINNSDLFVQVSVAVLVACEAIRTEAPATTDHAARLAWAKETLSDPDGMAVKAMRAVMAQNVGVTVAQATTATDAQVQTKVNNAIALLL